MSADHLNGGWPELPPVPPPIDRLPSNPTPRQVIEALGSTLLMFGQLWPRVVQALEYLRHWTERHDTMHALPPMRDPSDTQTVFVEKTKELIAREVAKLASMSPGPVDQVQAKPETIALVAGRVFEDQYAAKRASEELARLQKQEREDRDAAKKRKDERDADRRAVARTVIGGVLLAIAVAVGGYLAGHAKGLVDRDLSSHEAPAK